MKTRDPNLSEKASSKDMLQENRSKKKMAAATTLGNVGECIRACCVVAEMTVAIKRSLGVLHVAGAQESPYYVTLSVPIFLPIPTLCKAIGFVIDMSQDDALSMDVNHLYYVIF